MILKTIILNICSDVDGDGCDDCTSAEFSLLLDGFDFDGDGLCDLGDSDDDNDAAPDSLDSMIIILTYALIRMVMDVMIVLADITILIVTDLIMMVMEYAMQVTMMMIMMEHLMM